MVEDLATLREVAKNLLQQRAIAVDTESDSMHHYQEKVCLIQFSDLDADYIVDPLKVKDLEPLREVFENRGVIKAFHGADYDLVCLERDYGFKIRGLFDSLIAAQFLGVERIGLADLLDEFFGIVIEKQYQRHDWAERPLLPEHLEYARGDTRYLLALREVLLRNLRRAGRLEHFHEECRLLEHRKWTGQAKDAESWRRVKQLNTLDDLGKKVIRRLWNYRDGQAKQLNRPGFKVFPEDAMMAVAKARPKNDRDLENLFPRQVAMRRRHADGFLDAVEDAYDDPDSVIAEPKAERREKRKGPPNKVHGRTAERLFGELKTWRNKVVATWPARNAYSVGSNTTLKAISSVRPSTLEELAAIPEVRQWQVRDFGPDILELLEKHCPMATLNERGGEDDSEDSGSRGGRRRRRR